MSLTFPRFRRGISGNSVFRMISFINKSRKLLTTYYLLLTTYLYAQDFLLVLAKKSVSFFRVLSL
jgi:hypothetical protein